MSDLLWFGPDPEDATCSHQNKQDSKDAKSLYCETIKVCEDCKKGFIEGEFNKALVIEVSAAHQFFDVPVEATKDEVMKIACDVVGTYGEDISTIIIFEKEPKIKWKQTYYCD